MPVLWGRLGTSSKVLLLACLACLQGSTALIIHTRAPTEPVDSASAPADSASSAAVDSAPGRTHGPQLRSPRRTSTPLQMVVDQPDAIVSTLSTVKDAVDVSTLSTVKNAVLNMVSEMAGPVIGAFKTGGSLATATMISGNLEKFLASLEPIFGRLQKPASDFSLFIEQLLTQICERCFPTKAKAQRAKLLLEAKDEAVKVAKLQARAEKRLATAATAAKEAVTPEDLNRTAENLKARNKTVAERTLQAEKALKAADALEVAEELRAEKALQAAEADKKMAQEKGLASLKRAEARHKLEEGRVTVGEAALEAAEARQKVEEEAKAEKVASDAQRDAVENLGKEEEKAGAKTATGQKMKSIAERLAENKKTQGKGTPKIGEDDGKEGGVDLV